MSLPITFDQFNASLLIFFLLICKLKHTIVGIWWKCISHDRHQFAQNVFGFLGFELLYTLITHWLLMLMIATKKKTCSEKEIIHTSWSCDILKPLHAEVILNSLLPFFLICIQSFSNSLIPYFTSFIFTLPRLLLYRYLKS